MSSSYPIPAPGEEAPPPPIPAYTLFNADSVGLATFLGTPIAGGILMAVNYRRLGKGGKAAAVLLIALLVTALALVFGYLVPQGVSAYAELVFTRTMWPDFDASALAAALREFHGRQRRFGTVPQVPAYRQEAWLD